MSAYIKFDGVDGESKDSGHDKWSDLLSMSQGLSQPISGATGAARRRGNVNVQDVSIVKLLDKSSPKLAEAVCKGRVFPKVEIDMTATNTDGKRATYYRYELKNVLVSSYQVSGSANDQPVENVSLNFEEIKVTYTENDNGKKKGNVEYSWKVEEGS
ncbi:MAG: type VI secretion system tube protein Hcp [Planctomycetota bacterium]